MPKERSINPAQQQRKADKQKALAKSKKQVQSQRNEKLARRNPERLQKQIDELKELEGRGVLRPKDKETLSQLERDLKGVRRARDALGDAAPRFASHDRPPPRGARDEQLERRQEQQQHPGKRRRDQDEVHSDSEDTDPEVRDIPMPRDTPPPIPNNRKRERFTDPQVGADGQRVPHALPAKPVPVAPAQTTYSSAPQIRDLKKEAVRFMPTTVAANKARLKGTSGRLLEPEEADRLEKAGYAAAQKAAEEAGLEARIAQVSHEVQAEGKGYMDLDEEARRFEKEVGSIYPEEAESMGGRRAVQMEEVDDEGD